MNNSDIVQVFDKFVISSLASIESCPESIFDELGVTTVISLGCSPHNVPSHISHLIFPEIRDECDQFLLSFWKTLFSNLEYKRGFIWVHCVYGQSRSAATILALYLFVNPAIDSLENIHHAMKVLKPNISINPSFLFQLQFLISFTNASIKCMCAEKATFLSISKSLYIQYDDSFVHEEIFCDLNRNEKLDRNEGFLQKIILCRACKGYLASDLDIIQCSQYHPSPIVGIIDEYWLDLFKSIDNNYGYLRRAPLDNQTMIVPKHWVLQQLQKAKKAGFRSEQIYCPHCSAIIGTWEPNSVNLICPYLPVDCYAFNNRAILQQRKAK